MILSIPFCTKISNMFFKKSTEKKKERKKKLTTNNTTRAPIIIFFRNEQIKVPFIFCVFEYFMKWMEWSIVMECRPQFTTTKQYRTI